MEEKAQNRAIAQQLLRQREKETWLEVYGADASKRLSEFESAVQNSAESGRAGQVKALENGRQSMINEGGETKKDRREDSTYWAMRTAALEAQAKLLELRQQMPRMVDCVMVCVSDKHPPPPNQRHPTTTQGGAPQPHYREASHN